MKMSITDSVSTNMTNTMSTNLTSAVSITSDDKNIINKTDCYILYTFLLVVILLFIITIACYNYAKYRSKQKTIGTLTI